MRALAVAAALVQVACAGDYVARTSEVRRAYEGGDTEGALARLDAAPCPERDRLLHLMDRGMVLHAAGRWAESNAALEQAEQLAARLEIVSLSEEVKTLASNERERAYRGEDFEKVLLNVFRALNYAALGEEEEALVEVRRVHERLEKMIREEGKPYEQLAIARYLGGVLWEDQGELDAAYIDYEKAAELAPFEAVAEPLLRLAAETGREDALVSWSSRLPAARAAPLAEGEGQIVVVVEYGLSPQKTELESGPQLIAVPHYRPRAFVRDRVKVRSGGSEVRGAVVSSIEQVAQVHLADRLHRIALRSAASTAIKAGVAAGVASAADSEGLGWLTFWLLASTTRADLRSWLSLPAEFQIARLRAPAGRREIEVEIGRETSRHTIAVRPGRVSLLVLRRYGGGVR